MSSLPPPPEDLPEPTGQPVPGLGHPTGAISGSWPEPPVDAPSPFAPPGGGAFAPPGGGAFAPPGGGAFAPPGGGSPETGQGSVPPQFPPPQPPQFPPPQFPPIAGQYAAPPGPGLPAPPGGWIQPEAYGEAPPPHLPPPGGPGGPGGPGAPYGGGYQAYRPGMRAPSYAGFWSRLGANFIDSLIVGVVPAILYGVGIATSPQDACTTTYDSSGGVYTSCGADLGAVGPYLIAAFLAYVLLSFFVIVRPIGLTGQSIGSRAAGVRVIDSATGRPIGVGRSFGRFLAALFISRWCCNLGFLWMLWDDRKQTWHDKLATAIVVDA